MKASIEVSPKDMELIDQIVARAFDGRDAGTDHHMPVFGIHRITDRLTLSMDITAVHTSGCPLDLERMLNSGYLDFDHDIIGITRNIDRVTGTLMNLFEPRNTRK